MSLNYTLKIVKMANFIIMYIITNILISKKGKKEEKKEYLRCSYIGIIKTYILGKKSSSIMYNFDFVWLLCIYSYTITKLSSKLWKLQNLDKNIKNEINHETRFLKPRTREILRKTWRKAGRLSDSWSLVLKKEQRNKYSYTFKENVPFHTTALQRELLWKYWQIFSKCGQILPAISS